MKTMPMTALVLFAGATAVWLAATIDPLMLMGSACGSQHCWRCGALIADLPILITAAVRQITPKPAYP
jgi:hypothetical protein